MENSTEGKPVSVRLPAGVKKELAKIADKEKRSMNQTFILLIERGIAAYARDRQLFEPEAVTGAVEAHPGETIEVPTFTLGEGKEEENTA